MHSAKTITKSSDITLYEVSSQIVQLEKGVAKQSTLVTEIKNKLDEERQKESQYYDLFIQYERVRYMTGMSKKYNDICMLLSQATEQISILEPKYHNALQRLHALETQLAAKQKLRLEMIAAEKEKEKKLLDAIKTVEQMSKHSHQFFQAAPEASLLFPPPAYEENKNEPQAAAESKIPSIVSVEPPVHELLSAKVHQFKNKLTLIHPEKLAMELSKELDEILMLINPSKRVSLSDKPDERERNSVSRLS